MEITFDEFYTFTSNITLEASDMIASTLQNKISSRVKSDGTIVTETDLQIESHIRKAIELTYPNHAIVGEEFGDRVKSSRYTWVIDPIDGTFSYNLGVPFFGTLIGLLDNGIPLYGAMRLPLLDQMIAGDGLQCMQNQNPCSVKIFDNWENSLILTTDEGTILGSSYREAWDQLRKTNANFRTWGDCYGYYLLVTGKADAMLDISLKPCDILPLIPILKGAGAKIIDLGRESNCDLIACLPEMEAEIQSFFGKQKK
jgi:myo-inositol-1(or 4)-monophosphatase